MSDPAASVSDRTAPEALWAIASYLIDVLAALFGAPAIVAARWVMPRRDAKLLLEWLRRTEAVLRRLLLIEAAAYACSNTPPRPACRSARAPRRRGLGTLDPEHPELWRVSFRALTSAPHAHAQRTPRGRRRAARELVSAHALALRFEALRRAFAAPLPYAQRIARRLRAAPARLLDLLTRLDPLSEGLHEEWEARGPDAIANAAAVFLNSS